LDWEILKQLQRKSPQSSSSFSTFSRFFEVFYAINNISDVLAGAEAAGMIFIAIISFSKIATFWVWKEKSRSLIDRIKEMTLNGEFFRIS
jgi:hypothetical protein